jgi:hypothetical protein
MACLKPLFPVLLGLVLAGPACAQPQAAAARLQADLLAATSATQVLTRYCADLRLASPPVIQAVREETTAAWPMELRCGTHVLSNADNWYLPSRLTPEMNRLLDETETPFGTVVRPLDFHRQTLEASAGPNPGTVLRIKALLLTAANAPFSLVIENYSPELVASPR